MGKSNSKEAKAAERALFLEVSSTRVCGGRTRVLFCRRGGEEVSIHIVSTETEPETEPDRLSDLHGVKPGLPNHVPGYLPSCRFHFKHTSAIPDSTN